MKVLSVNPRMLLIYDDINNIGNVKDKIDQNIHRKVNIDKKHIHQNIDSNIDKKPWFILSSLQAIHHPWQAPIEMINYNYE